MWMWKLQHWEEVSQLVTNPSRKHSLRWKCKLPSATWKTERLRAHHIAPEFISNCDTLMLNWLREIFSQCMCGLRLPTVWRRADIIAVLKPNKSADDAKNYRPISLLCVPLKLLERSLLSRLDAVIDRKLPPEQAGFRHGRSTTDQVTLLTDDIEAGFEHNQKVGEALVDLTAAYDNVWLRGRSDGNRKQTAGHRYNLWATAGEMENPRSNNDA